MKIHHNKPLSEDDRRMFNLLKKFVYNGLNDKQIYEKLEVDFRLYIRKKQGHSICSEFVISKDLIYNPIIRFYQPIINLGYTAYQLTGRHSLDTFEKYAWMVAFYQFANFIILYNHGLDTLDEFVGIENNLGRDEQDKVKEMTTQFFLENGIIQTTDRAFTIFYIHHYTTISHQVLLISIPILLFPFQEDIMGMRFYHCMGYFNRKFQVIVEPKFGFDCGGFKEGLAYVSTPEITIETKYGYIDKKGNEVIPLMYESASSFNEGVGAVQLGEKWGVINKQGEVVVDFKYTSLSDCIDGHFIFILDSKLGIINTDDEIITISEELKEVNRFELLGKLWELNSQMSLIKEEGKDWVWLDSDGGEIFRWKDS